MAKKVKIRVDDLVYLESRAKLLDNNKYQYFCNSELTWDGTGLRLNGQGQKTIEAIMCFLDPYGYASLIEDYRRKNEQEEAARLKEKEQKYDENNEQF